MRSVRISLLLLALAMAACSDPFGPRAWDATPVSALLYSSSRAEFVGRASAFDFIEQRALPIESPGSAGAWDIALSDGQSGLTLVPAGVFEGITSRAGIAVFPNTQLADVTEAPRDTAAFRSEAVAVEPNTVYVIRTRRGPCGFGTTGFRYAKLQATAIDAQGGTLRFEYVRNPLCNDRSFVPPTR